MDQSCDDLEKEGLFGEGTVFSVPSVQTIKTDLFPGFCLVESKDVVDNDKLVFSENGRAASFLEIKDNNHVELITRKASLDKLLSDQSHAKMAEALQALHDIIDKIKDGKRVNLTLEQLDDLKRRISPKISEGARPFLGFLNKKRKEEYLKKVLYPEQYSMSPIALGDDWS